MPLLSAASAGGSPFQFQFDLGLELHLAMSDGLGGGMP